MHFNKNRYSAASGITETASSSQIFQAGWIAKLVTSGVPLFEIEDATLSSRLSEIANGNETSLNSREYHSQTQKFGQMLQKLKSFAWPYGIIYQLERMRCPV